MSELGIGFGMNTDMTNGTDSKEEANEILQAILQNIHTQTIVLSITMVLALVGNLFLAFLITKMSQRRLGPVQILILHTCAADICFALCTALPQMASTLTFPHFYGGDFLCKLVKYLQLIPMYASPYLLVAISIDRYVAICRPLVALRWKYRLVHLLAGMSWTAALLFSVPNIFNFRYDLIENTSIMSCLSQLGPELEQAWITVFALLVWVIPSVGVGVFYTFVCATVWRSMRCSDDRQSPEKGPPIRRHSYISLGTLSTNGTDTALVRKTYTPSINSYKLKTVKLTLTIVVANFLLWAPFCIINVAGTYFPDVQIDDMVATCIILVGNANSCVNPWIYVIFNYERVMETLCGKGRRSNSSQYRNILTMKPAPVASRKEPTGVRCGHPRVPRVQVRKLTVDTSLERTSIVHKSSAYERCSSVGTMHKYSRLSLGDLNGYRQPA